MKRTTIAAVVLSASLVVGGAALAQTGNGGGTTNPPAAAQNMPLMPRFGGQQILSIISDKLGVDQQTLISELQQSGATWASVIAAHNGDLAAIQQAIVDAIVQAETPDPTQIAAQVGQMLNNGLSQRGFGAPGFGPVRAGVNVVQIISDALNVDVQTLQTEVHQNGATWASVIAAHNGDLATIEQSIVDSIVKATGRTADEVKTQVDQMLNNTLPMRPQGGFGGFGGPQGGFPGGRGGQFGGRGGQYGGPQGAPNNQPQATQQSPVDGGSL